ncbi:McKusick-Kaufman/Bardet-Biedl syndromes putative chaperonin-like [Branchiostoma floridae]|uniref:McKusick-Kaufman/Bardet-Biedl syndromes putative chaperonin-like n=1 Tax=Branchiostoma floridae TaxID=7739 RepID=A0A9J7LHJ7_BRAFL|nr:McKusick-Kaufman/Bardet-Biedl syndromes putative chaperonin-like [Branchiostoma floridae]XP_035683064.1 McKusick-Kaufman/Bardet-Biedl syndromes putative chaperonin-like [Branchiostoma floridae]
MSRVIPSPKQQSSIVNQSLKDPKNAQAISTFRALVQSCYGPTGRLKMIHNASGGHVTTTSTSQTLFRTMSVSNPVVKLIVSAVQSHTNQFSDGGLFAALLCSLLVESCLALLVPQQAAAKINEEVLHICLEYLQSENCLCKASLNVGDATMMLALVRSVLGSKPALMLNLDDLNFLSRLVLQAFLKSIPDTPSGTLSLSDIEYICVEGCSINNSRLEEGVLFETPKITKQYLAKVKPRKVHLQGGTETIKVALFNTSLSGDSDEFIDTAYEADVSISGDESVLRHLMQVAAHLVQLQVGVLACQKVVHPGVQKYLAENAVLTVDRLGSLHIVAVQRLTGATAIGTLHATINEDSIGHLQSVSTVQIQQKNYLHLQSSTSAVTTLVLCNRNEAALQEMKDVCITAHHVLCQTLRSPLVLCGGGCTETHLAAHLRTQVTMKEETLLAKLGCSKAQLYTTANNFARCLEQVAIALEHDGGCHVSDPVNHHHWLLPPWASTMVPAEAGVKTCACGMVKSDEIDSCSLIGHLSNQSLTSSVPEGHGKHDDDKGNCSLSLTGYMDQAAHNGVESSTSNVVLDSFPVKLNAFVIAVETADMILTVNRTIFDKN